MPYWFVDAGAAMMLVLLAAVDEGLAAAFVGHPDQEKILRELLDLPDDVVPIGVTLVGHPAEDPDAERAKRVFAERRRPFEQIVHRERWA